MKVSYFTGMVTLMTLNFQDSHGWQVSRRIGCRHHSGHRG